MLTQQNKNRYLQEKKCMHILIREDLFPYIKDIKFF